MKQNISPVTAAIIAIVFVAVVALVGYKYFAGTGKGNSSQADRQRMENMSKNQGEQMRKNAERAGHTGGGASPIAPGR